MSLGDHEKVESCTLPDNTLEEVSGPDGEQYAIVRSGLRLKLVDDQGNVQLTQRLRVSVYCVYCYDQPEGEPYDEWVHEECFSTQEKARAWINRGALEEDDSALEAQPAEEAEIPRWLVPEAKE